MLNELIREISKLQTTLAFVNLGGFLMTQYSLLNINYYLKTDLPFQAFTFLSACPF